MEKELSFDEIRPYRDDEVSDVITELTADDSFMGLTQYFNPSIDKQQMAAQMLEMKTSLEFQGAVIYPALQSILEKSADGFTTSGFDELDKKQSYIFVSNHRDIILDPALLNYTLFEHKFNTTEIAIGDNLLLEPWIEKLVRLNKSFIVHRNVQGRQSLYYAMRLSNYMRSAVTGNKSSLWIAQREGRTKDGDDRTQASLLKMLNMSGENDVCQNFSDLHIVPVSLSYEYDPCDVMKIWETSPEFAQITAEEDKMVDLKNMVAGVKGRKGRIHFAAGTPIKAELDDVKAIKNKNEKFQAVASLVDHQIWKNYALFPCNYIAHDICHQSTFGAKGKYSSAQVSEFEEYLDSRIKLLDSKLPDLKKKLLEMYAYPVVNNLKTK